MTAPKPAWVLIAVDCLILVALSAWSLMRPFSAWTHLAMNVFIGGNLLIAAARAYRKRQTVKRPSPDV